MKNYKFKIGVKNLELIAPSIEAAYKAAKNIKIGINWKGSIKLIN